MSRRSPLAAAAAAFVTLLLLALPAAAKEGGTAQLDTAIPRDADPGSTIDVGWVVFMADPAGRQPITGSPVFIRLVSPTGATAEAAGHETSSRSGHYEASIVVPAGGIARVEAGLRGESCDQSGCERSDLLFAFSGSPLADPISNVAPAPATADPADKPAANPATSPAAQPATAPVAPWVLIAGAVGATAVLAIALGRRRVRGERSPV